MASFVDWQRTCLESHRGQLGRRILHRRVVYQLYVISQSQIKCQVGTYSPIILNKTGEGLEIRLGDRTRGPDPLERLQVAIIPLRGWSACQTLTKTLEAREFVVPSKSLPLQ